jgi:pimeloyl-ACP methyl ester carboxylesterase
VFALWSLLWLARNLITMPPVSSVPVRSNRMFRRILILILGFGFFLAVAGITYQQVSLARDRRAYLMPGELVDVGGYKMHIDCTGSGSPAVILDSGLGDSYVSWRKVQPEIAQFARVCSYDRAGLGYSDFRLRHRTSKDIAEELQALLRNAQVQAPYVLVGHSMGGYDVRVYASLYPNEVAGMVLVDASHPEQQKRFPQAINDLNASDLRQQEFLAAIMPFGIPRLLGFCGGDSEIRAAECNFYSALESVEELREFPKSAVQAAGTRSLGDLPLAVLSSDPNMPHPEIPEDLDKPTSDAWQQMQEELAHLSTRGTRVVAKNSGHYIQLDRSDLVVNAIRSVVNEARMAEGAR